MPFLKKQVIIFIMDKITTIINFFEKAKEQIEFLSKVEAALEALPASEEQKPLIEHYKEFTKKLKKALEDSSIKEINSKLQPPAAPAPVAHQVATSTAPEPLADPAAEEAALLNPGIPPQISHPPVRNITRLRDKNNIESMRARALANKAKLLGER